MSIHLAESLGGNSDGSGDGESALTNRRDKQFQRHTLEQKQQLEEFFKNCPHPNKKQRQQLSEELKLEPQQIKFWFQNRRTQRKTENGRANTDALKLENEKLLKENLAMKEAIINSLCPTCDGLPLKDKHHQSDIQKLRTENLKLRQEHERLSKAAETAPKTVEKPILEIQSLLPSMDVETNRFVPLLDRNFGCADHPPSSYQFCTIRNVKKFVMIENVSEAMEELTMLLKINEPVWIESSVYGSYTLHRDNYNRTFERPNHLKSSTTRIESSKFSGLVAMTALQLLDMFMNPNKWMELFPTLVTNARTIEVIDASMLGDDAGSMQLMYQRMHALSPLVAPREFYFLRYCRQVEPGLFVMADVSHDYSVSNHEVTDLHCWRKPSGCMIKDMSNGYCEVTWVEHVEVDDVSPTHCFYRELVHNSSAYGAQRWILTLQRMIERLAFTTVTGTPNHALEGGIMPEVRSILMDLTHRMIKSFWENLNMRGNQDFPPLSDMLNDEVQVSVRQNDVPGQPSRTIFSASSSLWLGLSREALFDFFDDKKTRVQWDLFTDETSMKAMVDISFGTHPGNRVSIFQASSGSESSMFILQESVNDPLGSLIVYAPIHFEWIRSAISGVDPSYVPILPVGFIISADGYVYNSGDVASTSSNTRLPGGSLLTMFFQMFVEPVSTPGASIEAVATIKTIVTSTMNKIKAALNC